LANAQERPNDRTKLESFIMEVDNRLLLKIGFSPDPDDAFMWWPLVTCDGSAAEFDTGEFQYEAVVSDIESLNQRSMGGDLEITAMSCAQYPFVSDHYVITACGSSMGDAYGPKLVARQGTTLDDLRIGGKTIAIPGKRTSAFATTNLLLGKDNFTHEVVDFKAIIDRVAAGEFDAGLVIHEGQLTYESAGLELLVDLGQWWGSQNNGLPLPLGINTIRRDLDDKYGHGTLSHVTSVLLRSLEFALSHREEALAYAMQYARDTPADLADKFVAMYVNKWTLDFGLRGREAVQAFLRQMHEAGLAPALGEIDFVEPTAEKEAATGS